MMILEYGGPDGKPPPQWRRPVNHECWALCYKNGSQRWRVRRIVWGQTMARAEKREGEAIKRASITLRD